MRSRRRGTSSTGARAGAQRRKRTAPSSRTIAPNGISCRRFIVAARAAQHRQRAALQRIRRAERQRLGRRCVGVDGGIEQHAPMRQPRLGQHESDRFVMRVEQQQQVVVVDRRRRARRVRPGRVRTGRRRGSARSPGSSRRPVISWPSGLSQTMSLASVGDDRAAVKERAAAKERMAVAQRDQAMGEVDQVLRVGRELPVDPRQLRCPGSRRCCCPAACGPSRRRRGASERPARAAASRGNCASAARAAPGSPDRRSDLRRRNSSSDCRFRRRGSSSPLASLCFSL